jgi:hypothetical protein
MSTIFWNRRVNTDQFGTAASSLSTKIAASVMVQVPDESNRERLVTKLSFFDTRYGW